jgi:hypothetical protein
MPLNPTHHIVEVFLPLTDNQGISFAPELFEQVRDELLERFGGVTFFSRNPAEGLWEDGGDRVSQDQVITAEVIVDELDSSWWSGFRERLEKLLRQEEVLVRACPMIKL